MKIRLLCAILLLPQVSHAQDLNASVEHPVSLAASLIVSRVNYKDAQPSPDLEVSIDPQIRFSYGLIQNTNFEATVSTLRNVESKSESDNVGTFTTKLDGYDFAFGLAHEFECCRAVKIIGRGGALFYNYEFTVEEEFYGYSPGGSVTAEQKGTGLYFGVAGSYVLSANWSVEAELLYKQRFDFFEDTSKPFDVVSIGIGVGAVRRF